MPVTTLMWIVFSLLVGVMLAVDLFGNRRGHQVSLREAALWSLVWISLALFFNAGIWFTLGSGKALEFFSGYLLEKALSVDNLFVFIMIFSYFGVRGEHQSRILKYGILGAIVMRALFIFAGAELLTRFDWLFYVFGALLLITAVKMALSRDDEEVDPEKNLLVRLVRRLLPVTRQVRGDWFVTRRQGILVASPLLVALIMVEWSDLVFAVDSIPAIFAVTLDPFIVFSSNIFAILGLRSLYFLLAGSMELFAYLKHGIAFILFYIGGKMIALAAGLHIPLPVSLAVIFLALTISVGLSLVARRNDLVNEEA